MTCKKETECVHGEKCFMKVDYDVARCTAFKSKVQTNEEWLRTATTERLAEALAWIEDRGELPTVRKENVKAFVEWLKQPHQE